MAQDQGVQPTNPAGLMERIKAINLEKVMMKLQKPDKDDGPAWSKKKCEQAEIRYRNFLYLAATRPDQGIVPTPEVDKMWHAHILDTLAYGPDCERTFGFFLHHYPYFGLNGPEDATALGHASEATHILYEQTFGEPYEMPESLRSHPSGIACSTRPKECRNCVTSRSCKSD